MTPDGGPVGRGVELVIDTIARMFQAIKEAVTPAWVERIELRRRRNRAWANMAWISREVPPGLGRTEALATLASTASACAIRLRELGDG